MEMNDMPASLNNILKENTLPLPLLQDYRYYDVFSAVFKISDLCNLHCTYCYRENAAQTHALQHMDLNVVDEALASILEYKKWLYNYHGWNTQPTLYFIWHGGEPLIVGIDRFKEIIAIQNKYRALGLTIYNCVQTNGTLINEEFFELFQSEYFLVGISIDGPRDVHNIHRVYRSGAPSFDETYKGIQLLQKHKYNWSAISVINVESIGKEEEIFNFFKNEKPREVDFTPAFFYETEISLPPKDYAKFMIRMFDLWIAENPLPFEIRFFKDVLYLLGYKSIPNKTSIICELSGNCHRNISIGSNGDVYSCECLNSKPSNIIGNILEKSFYEIVIDEPFVKMSISTNKYKHECLECEVFSICRAGCYNRRLPNADGLPRFDFYCEARKAIIKHIMEYTNKHC